MLPALAFGLALMLLMMMALRWFVMTPPAVILRAAKWTGLALAVSGGLMLVFSGRLSLALAILAGLATWALRLLSLSALMQSLRAAAARMGGGQASPGGSSSVDTAFLHMTLDHDTGTLGGVVTHGRSTGRRLSDLSGEELLELWRECQSDPPSVQVLEAWLDRNRPDWRAAAHGPAEPPPSAEGPRMSRAEALRVLDLGEDATDEDIRAAHRRLMMKLHPDHGGSSYLAAKINQAKDVLLDH